LNQTQKDATLTEPKRNTRIMQQDFIKLSYVLPEGHFFERRPDDGTLVTFAKNAKSALGQLKIYILGGKLNRTEEYVKKSYEPLLKSMSNSEWYRKTTGKTRIPRREGKEIIVGDPLLIVSVQAQILSQIFNQLDCKSILDVGSGRGNECIALASLNPDRELFGIELTKNGYERSLEWKSDMKKADMPLVDIGEDMKKIDFSKIHFFHGSGAAILLPDKSVDASFTHFVLEQIPRDYPKVLCEMRRVTKKYCVFIESFRESLSFADKLDLKNRDYFRFSYKNFKKYGLRPVYFSTAFLKKTKFGTGLLIAKVL